LTGDSGAPVAGAGGSAAAPAAADVASPAPHPGPARIIPGPRAVEEPGIHSANFHFPEGFLWGAATSAHQVEGDCVDNDWWAWEAAGRVPERSGAACNHYHRFHEDFDLAAALRHNAHRFSIEWSRIEPAEGVWSVEAIEHYRQVLLALHERGIEPIVTLLHFTLPRWLAERGGILAPEFEDRFERYVTRMIGEYGALARWWITVNEAVVQTYKGYLIGQWPPGIKSFPKAIQAVRHLLRGHVKAFHAIHALSPGAKVGIAHHALALRPCRPDEPLDWLSTRSRDYLMNQLFVDALLTGALRVPGLFWERLPSGDTLDFIGLNYYTRDFVRNTGLDLAGLLGGPCTVDRPQDIGKRNSLGWEVYPEGLGEFLQRLGRHRIPILITENGISTIRDGDRWSFIVLHLWQVARALSKGVPVVGYLAWSLLDNFEWANGYAARFGLIGVDYATQKRHVRESGWRLADVIRRNEL
jgi:beta-glucosidase